DKPLIQNLNLSVPAGSKVAIVGPTGAGKSTLINLIMRFYPVNKGEILLDNQPITAYSRDSLRKLIGMVLQETWLKSA
ncbi:ATP-binding cassette domain-containing protein, partial [Streptococcus pyogenes]